MVKEYIRVFENSLKDYLTNAQLDSYNSKDDIKHKYNNLKIYMDPEDNSTPHFWVSVNISSVCFAINTLERIDGGLGSDERYISMWASRANIKGELKKHWIYLSKLRAGTNNISNEYDRASDIITGTGINKNDISKQSRVNKDE